MRVLLGLGCAALLCGILVACLWPFHAPANQVTWLPGNDGLAFYGYGTAVSVSPLQVSGAQDAACSIEAWVQPAVLDDSGTILAFYTPQHPLQFELQQSLTDLDIKRHAVPNPPPWRASHFYAVRAFRSQSPRFITLSSGPKGTAVYYDGALSRVASPFRITAADCTGRLIVGTSPVDSDEWRGGMKGLAVYHAELAAAQVLRHYLTWTRQRKPALTADERCVALYLFREHGGSLARNEIPGGPDLALPVEYRIEHQAILEPFWTNFDVTDILANIVGFLPLGFLFTAFLNWNRPARSTALAVTIVGGLISLTIEVLQSYIPTRHSDSMDVLSNTLGAWLGVVLYKYAAARGFWLVRK